MISGQPYVIKCKDLDAPHDIYVFGDWHIYHRSCLEHRIRNMIEGMRKNPRAYAISVGDLAECIVFGDKRFNPHDIAPEHHSKFFDPEGLATSIILDLARMMRPVKERLIGLGEGNHEFKFGIKSRMWERAMVKDLADHLGARYLGYSSTFPLVFKCGKHTRKIQLFHHHGIGGGTTVAAKMRSLEKMTHICEADLYIQGHGHQMLDHRPTRLFQNTKYRLDDREMLCVMTGSFLTAYAENVTSYAEVKGYNPVALGNVAVRIIPNTGDMDAIRVRGRK